MWIRGGSEGDLGLKMVDPTKTGAKMNGKNGGSNETTHPLYIINKEMQMSNTRWAWSRILPCPFL